MALEPIGSMMSIQAQTTVRPIKTENAKPAVEYTDGSSQDAAQAVDEAVGVIEATQGKASAGDTGKDEQEQERQQSANGEIRKAVETMNKKMENSEAVFGIHEGTNRVTIKIVDKDTKKTIKELPPEKTLDMIAKVWEMAGILIDEKR